MRAKVRQRCPILIEIGGRVIKSDVIASETEQPADVAIRIRERGWSPYRVRFDDTKGAWIVASLGDGGRLAVEV